MMPLKTYGGRKKDTVVVNVPITRDLERKIVNLTLETGCGSKAQQIRDILDYYFSEVNGREEVIDRDGI